MRHLEIVRSANVRGFNGLILVERRSQEWKSRKEKRCSEVRTKFGSKSWHFNIDSFGQCRQTWHPALPSPNHQCPAIHRQNATKTPSPSLKADHPLHLPPMPPPSPPTNLPVRNPLHFNNHHHSNLLPNTTISVVDNCPRTRSNSPPPLIPASIAQATGIPQIAAPSPIPIPSPLLSRDVDLPAQ